MNVSSTDSPFHLKGSISGRKFTVGIIGAGDVVDKSHLPVLLALEAVSVEWVMDLDDDRAKETAQAYRVRCLPLPSNLEEIPHTDIVLLAVPYGVRRSYYEIFRTRDSALYVEKPLARNLAEHLQLCSWFPSTRLVVGFQRRAMGRVSLLKKLVGARVFGGLVKIEFRHGGSSNVSGGKGLYLDPRKAGGGVFFEHGIHGLDLAVYISNARSAHSYRVNKIVEKGFDIHAEGQVTLVNAQGEFELDLMVSWIKDAGEGLTFVFDNAVVHLSIGTPKIQFMSLEGEILMTLSDPEALYPTTSFQELAEYWNGFICALESGKENYTAASNSLLTTEILDQIFTQRDRS